jgi:zinc transport system substrate-binding protein
MKRILTSFLVLCVPVFVSCQRTAHDTAHQKPLVISTIKPIQALVYRIAGGAQSPLELHQLLPDGASPHHFALRPSDMQSLEQAKVIFRIDPALETFLNKPLASLPSTTRIIALADSQGVKLLPNRTPHHDEDENEAETAAEHSTAHDDTELGAHATHDLHIWLNPNNALAMTQTIADALAKLDPAHQADYQRNAHDLQQQIQATDQHIHDQLHNVQNQAYLSFHDAWQYFDTAYGLNFAGAVTLDVARLPGTRHVQDIRHIVETDKAVCLFQEPQFPPALVKTLAEGSKIKVGELDPLGMKLPLDENTYIHLLQNAADSFQHCLE